jgi:dTDP-4-dehydrorhamnose reductase
MIQPTFLILGATGMVGSEIFSFFQEAEDCEVVGFARDAEEFFSLDLSHSLEEQLLPHLGNTPENCRVINCVGSLRQANESERVITEYLRVNTVFPHALADFSSTYKVPTIHISTDAVFSAESGMVNEEDMPVPDDWYGKSKLLGESDAKYFLNIRTSFLGRSKKGSGLLEWARSEEGTIAGYTNQMWSGCSTRQFGALCRYLSQRERFSQLRELTSVFHFAPLSGVSKYEITRIIRKREGKSEPQPVKAEFTVTRQLSSEYTEFLSELEVENDVEKEINNLFTK